MDYHLNRSFAINWKLTEFHGWGLVGVHTCLYMLDHCNLPPLLLQDPLMVTLRPETAARIDPLLPACRDVMARIEAAPGGSLFLPGHDVLHALGGEFEPPVWKQPIQGVRNIGVIAGEAMMLDHDAVTRANEYDRVVIHSNYMRRFLARRGVRRVAMALQGVDPTEFHPAPRDGRFAGRFTIFSGGKLEFRKGQDIILAAFRVFHQRHPDALLVTAWNNLWPQIAMTMAESTHAPSPPQVVEGGIDITAWAVANGVPAEAFIDLGLLPRLAMGPVIRECDLAVFPNRCEAGTNLVAMETMACGVPSVLSANTGHLDLIAPGRCHALEHQPPVADRDGSRHGWGESSVEELIETMEQAYRDRDQGTEIGRDGAAFITTERTWSHFARDFIAACAP